MITIISFKTIKLRIDAVDRTNLSSKAKIGKVWLLATIYENGFNGKANNNWVVKAAWVNHMTQTQIN